MTKINGLRLIAFVCVIVGFVLATYFLFHKGSRQKSILLIGLFCIWVWAPFAALLGLVGSRSPRVQHKGRFLLIIVLSILPALLYSPLIHLPVKTAFLFLVIPAASWVILASYYFLRRY